MTTCILFNKLFILITNYQYLLQLHFKLGRLLVLLLNCGDQLLLFDVLNLRFASELVRIKTEGFPSIFEEEF
jgi:hypothetical protein